MRYLILLATTTLIYADHNETVMLNTLGQLGSILESQSTSIQTSVSSMLMLFSAILTVILSLISFISYRRGQDILIRVDRNKDKINKMTQEIRDEVRYIDKETNSNLKNVRSEILESLKDVKNDINQEVSQQIVHVAKEKILEVEDYAYRKIEESIMKINQKAQAKLFDYQAFIYKINEAKKFEYDMVFDNQKWNTEKKLFKIIAIQHCYNEINNQSVPKLFSEEIEEEVVPIAIKLSEYTSIKETIVEYLSKRLLDSNLSFANKSRIKNVLHDFYEWNENPEDFSIKEEKE